MSASRSTTWTVANATKFDWSLSSKNLDHGVWASNPPQVISAGKSGSFKAESDGFMTGDEGTVVYSSNDGDFQFYFNNPYIGGDDYNVTVPPGYDHKTNQTTGNDQVLNTRCFAVAAALSAGTTHSAQLICQTDRSVCSDIIDDIDLKVAKAKAKENYQTKYNANRNWKAKWPTFSDLLEVSQYKTT